MDHNGWALVNDAYCSVFVPSPLARQAGHVALGAVRSYWTGLLQSTFHTPCVGNPHGMANLPNRLLKPGSAMSCGGLLSLCGRLRHHHPTTTRWAGGACWCSREEVAWAQHMHASTPPPAHSTIRTC